MIDLVLALVAAVTVAGILWQPNWRLPDAVGEWAGVLTFLLVG